MIQFSRRSFLHAASAAGLGGVGLSIASRRAAAEDAAPRRKFTMCLACGPIGVRADPRETLALAEQYGFESVDPSIGFLMRLSEAELEQVDAELKQKKLVWGAAGLPVDFRRDEAGFKAGLDQLPETAKRLQQAGITRIATWLMPSHQTLTYTANFRQHARRLRETAKVLGDHGLRLGLEYVGPKTSWTRTQHPFIHTMAEMKDLIAEIDLDDVGFLLDSWHWYTASETEADLLTLTNGDIVCCHLNDAPAGIPVDQQQDNSRELPCATGVIDMKAFLGALVKIGYDGPVLIEPFYRPLREMPKEKALAVTAAAMKKAIALVE